MVLYGPYGLYGASLIARKEFTDNLPVASSAPARAGRPFTGCIFSAGARRALISPVASSAPARAGAHFTGCTTGSKPDSTGKLPVAQLKCYRWIAGCRSDATGKSPVADTMQPVK